VLRAGGDHRKSRPKDCEPRERALRHRLSLGAQKTPPGGSRQSGQARRAAILSVQNLRRRPVVTSEPGDHFAKRLLAVEDELVDLAVVDHEVVIEVVRAELLVEPPRLRG